MDQRPVRVRFAPSPTGRLHVGGARTALFNWLYARHHGGSFLLRIEDTDQSRYVEGAVDGLMAALRWLGLDWDEGPDIGGPAGPYVQSERLALYQRHAADLIAHGAAYECYCTPARLDEMRAAQQAAGQPTRYDRHCRFLSTEERSRARAAAETRVVRLAMPLDGQTSFVDLVKGEVSFDNAVIDDQVLLKSDGFPTYHLAVVVDDQAMNISHVLRSDEWLPSTPKHLALYTAFGWAPPRFAHLPMVLDEQRRKMSKRRGDQHGYSVYVHEYRDLGILPDAFINHLALLGWSFDEQTEIFRRNELVHGFSLERVSPSGAIFSQEKLRWFNGYYINHVLTLAEVADAALPFLRAAGLVTDAAGQAGTPERAHLLAVLALEKERLKLLTEVADLAYFFTDALALDPALLTPKRLTPGQARAALMTARMALAEWDFATLTDDHEPLSSLLDGLGIRRGDLFMVVRVAVTGSTKSPPLFDTLRVIGRERVLARLDAAKALLDAVVSVGQAERA
ncbi:MAG: glutamate--tRNA ligase [Chloroflexi bacterium]|nr:glutamate--tRNA ligase [Chloroflexota bacterium]